MTRKEVAESIRLMFEPSEYDNYDSEFSSVLDRYKPIDMFEHMLRKEHHKCDLKSYQIIRDYHDGTQKVISKKYPPIEKGKKRNVDTFKLYDRKLYNSISRSKQTVHELAKCNEWTYFVTFTFNRKKYANNDIEGLMKTFTKWLNNYSTRKLEKGKRIKYLLVPEIGKRGTWHVHGLMTGLPRSHLSKFIKGKHPKKLVERGGLNWVAYADKFGHCFIDKVRNCEAAARYSTKNITKSYATQSRGLGVRLYYCSNDLKRSVEIERGFNLIPISDYDYENEWVGVKWIKS